MWDFLKFATIVTIPFALYIYWTKIGYKVSSSYSWRVGRFVAGGIGSVTLINMKDRPVAIFGIFAVMDGLLFKLREFDPPLILKGMEAMTVDVDQVSERRLGSNLFEWRLPVDKHAEINIYLSTASKTVKCRRQGPPSAIYFALKQRLRLVNSHTTRFNNLIYDHRTAYAVTYIYEKKEATALIDNTGYIDWVIAPNMLHASDLKMSRRSGTHLLIAG